ncbi:MAG: SBBP repeat-containing protein [Candidatus Kapabacteria bacterium]|nr:SBBP repeat-containing protein [Candidatus Kapabacteria bacterium]
MKKLTLLFSIMAILTTYLWSQDSLTIVASTLLGKSGDDNSTLISWITFDSLKNPIISCTTNSIDYPISSGAYTSTYKGLDDFGITNFTSDLKTIKFSTLIGGRKKDYNPGIIYKNNVMYIIGITESFDYPVTKNAYQTNNPALSGSYSNCISVLSTNGDSLLFSTYIGGRWQAAPLDISFDKEYPIITGWTKAADYPTTIGAYQKIIKSTNGSDNDGFISKLTPDLSNVLISTFIGGINNDYLAKTKKQNDGTFISLGLSNTNDFPVTPDAYSKTNNGNLDITISKFDSTFSKLLYSSYTGGIGNDYSFNFFLQRSGNLAYSGFSNSINYPCRAGAYSSINSGSNDIISSIFKSDLKTLLYSSFIGGKDDELAYSLTLDDQDNILITASSKSNDFPTTQKAIKRTNSGAYDNVFVKMSPDLSKLLYSTYIGGSSDDISNKIITDKSNIYIGGYTKSSDYPTTNGVYQRMNNGSNDIFITKLGPANACDATAISFPDFKNTNGINICGDAKTLSDGSIELTNSKEYSVGAVWSKYKIAVKAGFTCDFSFKASEGYNRLDDGSEAGADGIAFILQNMKNNTYGSTGGYIGYGGMENCFVIEYDLFNNLEILNDPDGNHIGVFAKKGEQMTCNHKSTQCLATSSAIPIIHSNNTTYYSRIEYHHDTLKIYVDTTLNYKSPAMVLINIKMDNYISLDGNEAAWAGFTGATGSSYQKEQILSWSICPENSPWLTEVEEETEDKSYISPNPASEFINISVGEQQFRTQQVVPLQEQIRIYNMMGEELKSLTPAFSTGEGVRIDVSGLQEGVYYVRAGVGRGTTFVVGR